MVDLWMNYGWEARKIKRLNLTKIWEKIRISLGPREGNDPKKTFPCFLILLSYFRSTTNRSRTARQKIKKPFAFISMESPPFRTMNKILFYVLLGGFSPRSFYLKFIIVHPPTISYHQLWITKPTTKPY